MVVPAPDDIQMDHNHKRILALRNTAVPPFDPALMDIVKSEGQHIQRWQMILAICLHADTGEEDGIDQGGSESGSDMADEFDEEWSDSDGDDQDGSRSGNEAYGIIESEDGASQVNDSGLNEKDEFFEGEGDSSDATGDCHDGKFQYFANTSRTSAKAHRNATGPVARGLRVALQEAKANRTWISWTDLTTTSNTNTSNRVPYATTPQRNRSHWDNNTNPKMKRAGVYMIVYAGVSEAPIPSPKSNANCHTFSTSSISARRSDPFTNGGMNISKKNRTIKLPKPYTKYFETRTRMQSAGIFSTTLKSRVVTPF